MSDQNPLSDIDQAAITLVTQEKQEWEDAVCFVTDRIAFRMREMIKTLRRNYWGIFEQPRDPQTGRERTWVPLTESVVDGTVKNIDVDTKDVNFRAKNAQAIGVTSVIRNIVRDYLDRMQFGEYLDELERAGSIDGTCVWKTFEEKGHDGKPTLKLVPVDLLNFYIDPTARSIQDTPAVIERALMTPDEVEAMTGWKDTKNVKGTLGLSSNDPNTISTPNGQTRLVEIFERWGKMPKYLMTGEEKDKLEYIDGHIVVSNVGRGPRVHLIEKMKGEWKPYEEWRFTTVPGRWYGRGQAERVMMLQIWMNTIVNIRIARSYVSQLGIFKIRKGSGVTPQMFSRLASNGALVLENTNDVEQMVVQEASQASYNDEENIKGWAERVTSVFESVTGESMPSSTPATNAVLSSRAGQSQFTFVKEGLGMFLQRWLKRHAIPIMAKQVKSGDIVRITGEIEELREIDERLANHMLATKLKSLNAQGKRFDPTKVEAERRRILDKLAASGKDRFVKLAKAIDFTEHDVQVYVTNEEMDKATMISDLMEVFKALPAFQNSDIDPASVGRAIFDVMGLDTTQFRSRRKPVAEEQMAAAAGPQVAPQRMPARPAMAPPTDAAAMINAAPAREAMPI
jgi:hypothetical protein